MPPAVENPLVHIELHTAKPSRACAFYTRLFRWRTETVRLGCGSYLALDLGAGIGAGVIEREVERPMWLPYVEVNDVGEVTERARAGSLSCARAT